MSSSQVGVRDLGTVTAETTYANGDIVLGGSGGARPTLPAGRRQAGASTCTAYRLVDASTGGFAYSLDAG